MEYRVYVIYNNGDFCSFSVLSYDDIYDTIGSLRNVVAINIYCMKG